MYTYRSLIKSDYETICSFPRNAEELYYMFPSATFPLTPEQIEESVKNRMMPTAFFYNNELAAFANLYGLEDDHCWLGNVIVSPRHRGKGVARYLIETMSAIAVKELSVQKLKLVCHNTNTRALLLYTKNRFIPYEISVREKPNGEKIAGIHMELCLIRTGEAINTHEAY